MEDFFFISFMKKEMTVQIFSFITRKIETNARLITCFGNFIFIFPSFLYDVMGQDKQDEMKNKQTVLSYFCKFVPPNNQ